MKICNIIMKIVKTISKILFILLVIIAIGVVVVWVNEVIDNKKAELRSIGNYIFNFELSNVNLIEQDSIIFDGLEFNLMHDNKFIFSKMMPLINDSIGIWKVEGFGVDEFIVLYFSNGKKEQISTCCGRYNQIAITFPPIIDKNYTKYGRLAFVKTP